MIFISICVAILVSLATFLINRRVNYFKNLNLLHEPIHILYGNAKESTLGRWSVAYDIDRVYKKFKGNSPFAGFMRNFKSYLLPLNDEILKQILITNFKNFRNNDFALKVKRHSIITLNPFWLTNEMWKMKRSELSPALTAYRLKAMYPLIDDAVKEFSDYIRSEMNSDSSVTLDAREISLRYSCNSITSTTYAMNANAYEQTSEILQYGRRLWQNISDSAISIIPKKIVTNDVNQFFIKLMNQAIQHRRYNNEQRNDLLSYLIALKDKRNFSEIESASHATTFFLDGFETSSVALCYTLYELSKDTRVQEKLRKEINECCDDENQTIPIDTLLNLSYLDQVFYEAIRLHPPLYYTTRVCCEDIELISSDDEKQLITKGTAIWIPIYSIHRDAEYYNDPNEFHPERFNEEFGGVKAFRDKCVLIPFGDGSRICLGMKLGTLQIKAAVAELIRNFEIVCSSETSDENVKIQKNQFVNLPNRKISIQFKKILTQ